MWHEHRTQDEGRKGESHWYRWNGKTFSAHWCQYERMEDDKLRQRLADYYRDLPRWERGADAA